MLQARKQLGNLSHALDLTANRKLMIVVVALSFFHCADGIAAKGDWPWDYGGDHGKAQTGDYIGLRGPVMKFGDTPAAPKPAWKEPVQMPENAAQKIPAPSSEPAAATDSAPVKPGRPKPKEEYDFEVVDVKELPPGYVPDGSVATTHDITAANRGSAPVSVVVELDRDRSENLKLDHDTPLYAVVPPKTDLVLLHSGPQQRGTSYRASYGYSWGIGSYKAEHRCPERYRFPFSSKVKANASLADAANTPLSERYHITFTMPAGTTILAARKGSISRIKENSIDILHDDSTIATYHHLGKFAEGIAEGKVVSAGDPLAMAGVMGESGKAYIRFVVWRPEPKAFARGGSKAPSLGFTSVSFPIEFCTDTGRCQQLTKSQPVPATDRGKARSSKTTALK